jgi:hypothetical protein
MATITTTPARHPVLTQNASAAVPARLLVIFISSTGDPLETGDREGNRA